MKGKQLTKEKVTSKSNNTEYILIIMLIAITIVSSVIGLYAWAKYKSAIGGVAEAQVAKWHLELKEGETESGNTLLAFTRTDNYTHVEEGKVAPGTYGNLPIIIDTTKTEVDLVYNLEVKITNYPQNMMLKNLEGQEIIPEISGEGTEDSPRVATITVSKYVPYKTEDRLHDETIKWNWEYETGENADEILENDRIDTEDAGKEISVSVSVIGTQVLQEPKSPQIGDTVKLSTTLNGEILNDWKLFYKEGDYTYLILGDYLKNSAVNISEIRTKGEYCVFSHVSRAHLMDAMTTTTNWDSLLQGSINGKSYDYKDSTDENIYAKGSPPLDLFIKSWNEMYPDYILDAEADTIKYGRIPNSDTLYFPHTNPFGDNDCNGYWLATYSSKNEYHIMYVDYLGDVNGCSFSNALMAFRPIICLPSSVLE